MPQQFTARFLDAEEALPANAIVRLAAPAAVAAAVTPGQFVMLGGGQGLDPLLPRPYGIMRAIRAAHAGAEGVLELLVFTGGRGAGWLAHARESDIFPVVGPLGTGYELGERVRRVLLIAVGHGIGALVALAEAALARDIAVTMLVGAPTAAALLPLTYLPEDAEVIVATSDGSRGHHGSVTDLLDGYLDWADAICAYAPEPVYVALREALHRYRGARTLPPVQVAMERSMACGVGVCLGCVVETTAGLKTVCRDGPVFPLDRLVLA
ncbi:MAG: iron-sulfur cluster-binding protein [Thermomicrobiales bacterium]